MTRKKVLIFLFTYAISFFFLLFLVGEHGVTYMVALKREVGHLAYQKEELSSKVDSLRKEEQQLEQGSGVKDAAFKLGYQREGEQVYYFEEKDGEDSKPVVPSAVKPQEKLSYFHLPLWANALSALGMSVLFMVWYLFKVGKNDDEG
jgi:cell division protein FtsB